jgi:hypothetical protein
MGRVAGEGHAHAAGTWFRMMPCKEKVSSSFLKKRTKKLLFIWRTRCRNARTNKQKFLLLFPKRSAFLLPMAGPQ